MRMITKKIRAEFSGILALICALKRAWNAYKAYIKAIKAVSTVIIAEPIAEPITEWGYNVSRYSQLSYAEARTIYTVIMKETNLCTHAECGITEFIMDMANRGHTADMIISYMRRIDRELDK